MLVVHVVITHRELFGADQCCLLYHEAIGQDDARVNCLLGDRIYDVLQLDRDRASRAFRQGEAGASGAR